MADFKVTGGKQAGQTLKIGRGEQVIGSSATAQLRLQDDGVSRKHATVSWKDGAWKLQVHDKTKVNGKDVTGTVTIKDKDAIEVGGAKLELIAEQTGIQAGSSISADDFANL